MKTIGTFLLCIFCATAYAQVGVGTTDPQAALEVSNSTNGGFLVPRYALSGNNDSSTVTNPSGMPLVTGTLVYNTTAVTGGNALAEGFVFWNGSTWGEVTPASTGSAASWELAGNATTGSEFLGTTNFNSLDLRANGNQVALFHPNGGTALGIGAAANNNNSFAIGTGAQAVTANEATAVGRSANASGFQSSAIGYSAATSGNSSIAVGHGASTTGFQASALGHDASASNNDAIAVGSDAIASGLNSAAFGPTANASGQNATAIGWGSTAPNATTIILGNTDTNASNFTASKIGIGTNNPTAKLQVEGSLRYVDGNQAAGNVLTSDANGNATWAAAGAASSAIYGQVFKTSNTNGTNLNSAVIFGTSSISNGTTLSSTNIQTGATTGLYRITYTINLERTAGNNNIEFFLTQGFGAANKVSGSSAWASIRGGAVRSSLTKTILVDVNAGFQQFYVFPATTNADVRILPDSSLLIELVQAD